nr:hypothetical protein [Tanacetum cinerariifolium]
IARLRFRYLFVLPLSSEVTYASVTFPCIGSIIDIKSVLTQRALKVFCETFHIPDEVHPQLPSPNQTIHEIPTGKIEIDLLSFIWTADPTKVKIGERKRDEDEPKLLETTVGRVAPLLSEKQGDSVSGGHGVGIQLVNVVAETVVEDMAPVQPKRQKKQKTKVVDASEPSHPAKKLKDDHGALNGPTIGGKSQSLIQRLFVGAVQNVEVRGGAMPTLPFVKSSVSTTPEREGGDHTELLAGANLCTIGAPQRFVISSYSSDHSGVNIAEAEVDFVVRTSVPIITSATTTTPTADLAAIAKEKLVGSSVFGANFLSRAEFILFLVASMIVLMVVSVVRWLMNSPPKFFASVHEIEHEQLFTEFNVMDARQMSLSAKVRMRADYNIRGRRRLNSVVEEKDALLKAKDKEIGNLKAQLSEVAALKERNNLLETKKSGLDVKVADLAASVKVREQEVADLDVVVTSVKLQNDNLVDQVHKLEASSLGLQEKVTAYENCLSQLEKFQDDRMREINDKFDKLDTDLLLTHGLELAIAKCLNSTEYLSTLGAAISKAVEKGMQDELFVRITHGAEGRVLTDVAAYNLSAEADYLSALQRLQSPHVDQLMVPIHHSLDQRDVDASALSLSLDVSSSRVWRIKENIAKHRSALRDVFVPLSEPLSVTALTGTESTLNVIPAIVDTTTALSVTYVSASLIPPVSTDDYEITHAEGEKSIGTNANPFPDVTRS